MEPGSSYLLLEYVETPSMSYHVTDVTRNRNDKCRIQLNEIYEYANRVLINTHTTTNYSPSFNPNQLPIQASFYSLYFFYNVSFNPRF